MRLKTLLILATCIVLAACGRKTDDTAKPAASTPAAEAPHEEAANTVEVDQEMLRDLRLTTRAVESRTGGDLVMLLGELAVDQSAYAEVGAPVAARVTQALERFPPEDDHWIIRKLYPREGEMGKETGGARRCAESTT